MIFKMIGRTIRWIIEGCGALVVSAGVESHPKKNSSACLSSRCCKYFVLLVAFVTGCAASKPPQQTEIFQPASSEEILNSGMAYDKCLTTAARQVDDYKSDASTIALAIKSKCIPQAERHIRAVAAVSVGPGITPAEAYVAAKKIFEELYLEGAIKAVLAERAKRR